MRRIITFILATPVVLISCTDNSPPKVPQISAASCPLESMQVQSVSYNEEKGRYSIFHTYAKGGEKIKNPLQVENIQMAQISKPQGETSDFARLTFSKENGSCEPILEMTQGFKIELAAAPKIVNGSGEGGNGSHSGSGGSSWAPFLMGALVGNAISSAMQPRMAPAYYLPPPASSAGANGVVTGGVSAKTPEELNKKYESTYNKPAKKGFFSKKTETANDANKKGFFSRKKNDGFSNNDSPKKKSFFSGSRGSGGSRRR
ncbi:hypothetical protein [Fluviispira vulneris]|uniref:hypothetical protein n=1 Tax=Fluviispira vulneris TaxID=2763012 RepID=UPI0016468A54|nr:hypothetical protein [Fluviispira vulneris]